MAGLRRVHALPLLTLRVIHRYASLAALDEHHERGHTQNHQQQQQYHRTTDLSGADQLKRAAEGARQSGHDAGENQQRDAVADTPFGDLLAEPHEERRPGGQRQHRHEPEGPAGGVDDRAGAGDYTLEADGDPEPLDDGQHDGPVTGVLGDLPPPQFPFL